MADCRSTTHLNEWFTAVNDDDLDAVIRYAENGFSIDSCNADGETALMKAAWFGHRGMVQYLCEKGADIRLANCNGDTALHFAASGGHLKCCDMLVAKNADINSQNHKGRTPAHSAVYDETLYIAEYLASKGANTQIMDSNGLTILTLIQRIYGKQAASEFENKLLLMNVSDDKSAVHNLSF